MQKLCRICDTICVASISRGLVLARRRTGVRWTRHLLRVQTQTQRMDWFEVSRTRTACHPEYVRRARFPISTSRYGTGQVEDSHRTPLGLHRIAQHVGHGFPVGTVFEARKPVGFTWQGRPDAAIANRILWLEGLEPGVNRGGNVDSRRRYIYIHGVGDETTLGRPASRGCIHLAAIDLMPLFDRVPDGSLVWIE